MNKHLSAVLECGPLILLCTSIAETPMLLVRLHGTNQLELVASFFQNEDRYMVLACANRAKSPSR
jgi:hypothetical protein